MFPNLLCIVYILSNALTRVKKTAPMKPSQTLFSSPRLSYEITDAKHSLLLLWVFFLTRYFEWLNTLTEKKTTLLRVLMLLVRVITGLYLWPKQTYFGHTQTKLVTWHWMSLYYVPKYHSIYNPHPLGLYAPEWRLSKSITIQANLSHNSTFNMKCIWQCPI